MPEYDVVLTVNFLPAGGESHRISTVCKNGTVTVDAATDGEGSIAKAEEYIQFFIRPDEGHTVGTGGFVARVNGKFWTQYWFLGTTEVEGQGTVYLYEMRMPAGDVDVIINCTGAASANNAPVRIPVTVR